jgi:hypothetical protein
MMIDEKNYFVAKTKKFKFQAENYETKKISAILNYLILKYKKYVKNNKFSFLLNIECCI